MSGLKTLVILLFALPWPARAAENALTTAFASCAGRFSAELEHAWLFSDRRAEEIENHRLKFVDLINATVSPDQQSHALGLRINAKLAHAALLKQATFSQNQERARWALRRAEAEIAYCGGFLLES